MFSEVSLIVFVMIISSQSSTLWASLMIIPLSLMVIFLTNSNNNFSGLPMVLYVMVFIGGLMVLLVSVSSLSSQEQAYNFDKPLLLSSVGLASPFFFFYKIKSNSQSLVLSISWFESHSASICLSVFFILICLLVVSKSVSSFSGLIRSI